MGERLEFGADAGPFAAGRIEAVRPDGSRVDRDWGTPPWKLKLDQPGTWMWRLFIRDEGRTRVEEGELEVVASIRRPGSLDRVLRRKPSQ